MPTSLRRGSRSIHVSQLPYSWLSSLLETRACTQARSSARRAVGNENFDRKSVESRAASGEISGASSGLAATKTLKGAERGDSTAVREERWPSELGEKFVDNDSKLS